MPAVVDAAVSNRKKRNDRSCKVDGEIVRQGHIVADARGISLAEYLSSILQAPVRRDYEKAIRQFSKEIEGE